MLFLGIDVSKDKLDGAAVSEGTGAVLGRRSVPNTPGRGRAPATLGGDDQGLRGHAHVQEGPVRPVDRGDRRRNPGVLR